MERDVFENLSIASLMNRMCINIKVDREEHPELDEIYMVARQLLTHEGGWPNTLFLTPDLKPFYAGGTYAPDESYGKAAFPRLLEWLNFVWTTQPDEVKTIANRVTTDMQPFLIYKGPDSNTKADIDGKAEKLFGVLKQFYDERSGGFFQSPKFPHESYLQFLLGYYEATDNAQALEMVTHTLSKMAAGGIYDQVGCGFHRYAVDKEWYVPHFEKMLYNQAQLARIYTDAARLTANPYLADIAKGILEFVGGPFTSGNGTFYSALDAETDGVEGAHYAWTVSEIQEILVPEEVTFLTNLYALADIPAFPGHKHVEGQVLILRKPLDVVARERNLPYVQLAALSGQIMNKLLMSRNTRKSPRMDDKVIVGWNGLMIDAFAHAGKVFNRPGYTARAREAVDFILEHLINNEGKLQRIYASSRVQFDATLEDYAFLIKGLITLWRATPDAVLLDAATSLAARAEDIFADVPQGASEGYFFTQAADDVLVRIKNCDDSAVSNSNAVMLHNLIDLADITGDASYLEKGRMIMQFFMGGDSRMQVEHASMIHASVRLQTVMEGRKLIARPDMFENELYAVETKASPADVVKASATLFPSDPAPGTQAELMVTLDMGEGWHVNANRVNQPFLIPTQVDIQGKGVEVLGIDYPEPLKRPGSADNETLLVYEGLITVTAKIKLARGDKRQKIKVALRFQPCTVSSCYAVRDVVFSV